ncbi:MAG TPA: zinc-dependent metalloprotease, partial [Trebonia sp.]|nr:zinc-dependent metalloprotease [Trebonia sp.]
LTDARGVDGRDALWAHPDLLPTAEDLEDPDAFVRGSTDLDISDLEEDTSDSGDAAPEDEGTPNPEDGQGDQGEA